MRISKPGGGDAAMCVVTGQPTVAGYRATFSVEGVHSFEEGGYRYYALESPRMIDGREIDEYYEAADGAQYDSPNDVPADKATPVYLAGLQFRSIVVEDHYRPGTTAAPLALVAADIARDGRAGWLVWNPSQPVATPLGDELVTLLARNEIRIEAGMNAAQVTEAILAGGATRVERTLEGLEDPRTGQVQTLTVQIDQQVVPPLAGAYDELRRRAGRA